MLRAFTSTAFALAVLFAASRARAADPTPMPTPIDALGADLAGAFTGTNLIFYGAAVGETGAMAFGGGDHAVRLLVQRNLVAPAWGDAAYVAGYALPAIVAPGLWGYGLASHDRGALGAGSAALQALATTLATTALLKWTTGRAYPLNGGDPRASDVLDHPEYARAFRPFRLDGGWAWPSGHTSATMSVVAALSAFDPDHVAIPLVGYPIVAAIGLGMIDGDRHWTSDVIAGALVGYAIGSSIGASFRRRADDAREGEPHASEVHFVPMVANGALGGSIAGRW